jgi:hypothetical protein
MPRRRRLLLKQLPLSYLLMLRLLLRQLQPELHHLMLQLLLQLLLCLQLRHPSRLLLKQPLLQLLPLP